MKKNLEAKIEADKINKFLDILKTSIKQTKKTINDLDKTDIKNIEYYNGKLTGYEAVLTYFN